MGRGENRQYRAIQKKCFLFIFLQVQDFISGKG